MEACWVAKYERPTQISTDFKKTSALACAIQKFDFWGVPGVAPPNYAKILSVKHLLISKKKLVPYSLSRSKNWFAWILEGMVTPNYVKIVVS